MSTCREEPCSRCVDIVPKRIVARSKHLSCSSSKGHIFSGKASILDETYIQEHALTMMDKNIVTEDLVHT